MLEYILLFIISLLANAFSAFAGGGAGLLQLPALIFLGLPFSVALATHKLASVALGIGASARHFREKNLDRQFALIMLLAGVPGVVLGASVILNVPDRWAELALGLLTMGLGIYSWASPDLGQVDTRSHRDRSGLVIGGAVLFGIGFLNGSLTSGTGLFVTLWLIRWFGLDYKRAVAHTLVMVGLFWNGSGALTLGLLGSIRWDWLPVLLLGSLLGGYIGAHYSIIKGNRAIKRVFEFVTILVGLKLIVG
ncbi:MAG: sulfite exporter TauE/SafE family protein [Thiohalophilus sp.]|uniref:sulfite exporter TauE/SafE family protein n=1 Tax=Thiohalophilus sp. TaxID=3028392 RepID=UPI0028701CE2|nr:sulfite exporter TauE/SafE family protein [Thiohalophilus sp.]MDR9436602.1 sulfite exporter TauE/SafE family protein [Thiohalophilus sp.]